jgi:quinol monooxygenase YgiN
MSGPILVTMTLRFKPEAADEMCAALPKSIDETRKFKGFRDFRMHRHRDDDLRAFVVEEWDSLEDFAAYGEWRRANGSMNGFLAGLDGPPQVDIWPTKVV